MRNQGMILEQFDEITTKIDEARQFFENEMVMESDHCMHTVTHLVGKLDRTLARCRCHTPKGRSFNELTPSEVKHFARLNTFFLDLQDQTQATVTAIRKELEEKLKDKDPFINEYAIEVSAVLIHGENDPLSLDYDNNFICALPHPVFHVVDHDDDPSDDYNDMGHWPNHPLHGQQHCCFFHEILAHIDPKLSLDDILRIDDVWIDVKVWHQCYRKLPQITDCNNDTVEE